MKTFEDSSNLLGKPDALRDQASKNGYLFFKNFLSCELILSLRKQILEIIQKDGWLAPGSALMVGRVNRDRLNDADYVPAILSKQVYRRIQSLELFHSLPHHPRIISLFEALFQDEVFPHPRHIARILVSGPKTVPTPPHQDYVYIQGTHQFWTLWFSLGDCSQELGGLSVLKGSHRENILDVKKALGAGGYETILCNHEYEWVGSNYECGDILIFPSHTIHKGLPSLMPDQIRLSCDCRYEPLSETIQESSLRPHLNIASWEEIYKGWAADDLKYYWEKKHLSYSPWNPDLLKDTERIC